MLSSPEFKKKQIIFVFCNNGDKVSFSNDNVIVKNNQGKIIHQSTCYKLFLLILIGNTSITSGLLQRSKRFGFSICLMTSNLKVYGVINGFGQGNTLLRKYQYQYDGFLIGKHIINNKIENQRQALLQKRRKTYFDNVAIATLQEYSTKLTSAKTRNEIMGIEGAASKMYFQQIFDNTEWLGRKPRIKSDWLNSTLDIGYNILFNFLDAIVTAFGFDTYQGVLHSCFYMRKSLICDLMEPFRPIIDLSIRKAINLKQFKAEDFNIINYQYFLSWDKTPKYIEVFANELLKNKDGIFLYVQGYYRAFMKRDPIESFPNFKV